MRLSFFAAALVMGLAACGSDLLGPDFEQTLSQKGGCADVYFFAVDRHDRVLLTFVASGLVDAARQLGEPTQTTFDFPDPGATLFVERGTRISDAICDDVIENNGPQVERTWSAVGGRAIVTIRPGPSEFGARGDLTLEDVVIEDDRGRGERIERMEWVDVSVGWFPG